MKIKSADLQKLESARKSWDATNTLEHAIYNDLWELHEQNLSLNTLLDDLKDDPDSYPYTVDDLETFLETYDLV